MNKKTLTALRGSIAKWEKIAAGTGVDKATQNCPLCKIFNNDDSAETDLQCKGCPVMAATHQWGCLNTPYEQWSKLMKNRITRGVLTKDDRIAAQAELEFLKSLLPK